ncbi:hypothetical protein K470DRAFT_255383 [Piedraia hortae CBS 480.64]|uniref:SRP9 domain-containing protein n=1 Tax=Piedraia hortae CBS 480.64 TaxID=1314780 RepID=A0A6A7C8G4_9PEZI|nr:hypothetical protein K470DRAFT_255383 [Piedraia hortae CBS 480.64]
MVYLRTGDEWRKQSERLLHARPMARVTAKYKIAPSSPRGSKKASKKETLHIPEEKEKVERAPRAFLTLKTYDPKSGVTLKFKTCKATDLGRLIAEMDKLGCRMAGMEDSVLDHIQDQDVDMADSIETNGARSKGIDKTATEKDQSPVVVPQTSVRANKAPTQTSTSGVAKKKKKGKR